MEIVKKGLLDSYMKPSPEGWGLPTTIVSYITEARSYPSSELYDTYKNDGSLQPEAKQLNYEEFKLILNDMFGNNYNGVVLVKRSQDGLTVGSSDVNSNAGSNQEIEAGTSTYQLQANAAGENQKGGWSLFNMSGYEWNGSFDDASNPNATFTANVRGKFLLVWSLIGENTGQVSSSKVIIDFLSE